MTSRRAVVRRRREAEQLAERVAQLQTADDARTLWWIETAVTRDNAERARVALGLRGIDIDNPAERVTAQDWLDAHEAEKLADDVDRALTEHDLDDVDQTNPPEDRTADHRTDDTDRVEEPGHDTTDDGRGRDDDRADALLTAAPALDIRDTAQPDSTERIDPEQRRRVPPRDETTAAVERAQLALAEIENRRAAEAAELARAAGAEPDEDDRRANLNRWAVDDQQAADTSSGTDRAADHYDGEAMER